MHELKTTAYTRPFRHWLLEDLVVPSLAERAAASIPPRQWPGWVHYDNDCEKGKRTTRDLSGLGDCWQDLFGLLASEAMVGTLEDLTGIAGLRADPKLHGAGLHVTDPGGWLQPHLDYAAHPLYHLERRLSLIVFLNRIWDRSWGGAVELYPPEVVSPSVRQYPLFRGALLFENSDVSYHGTQRVSPEAAEPRATAAFYYLAPPRPGCVRRRALFVPRREGHGPSPR